MGYSAFRLLLMLLAMITMPSRAALPTQTDSPNYAAGVNIDSLPVLEPGETVEGEFLTEDTPVLERLLPYPYQTVRGKLFRLRVKVTGPHFIELKSHFFDEYFILLDSQGRKVELEDHPQFTVDGSLTVKLDAARTYLLWACALYGGIGPYELSINEGAPPSLQPEEAHASAVARARRSLEVVEKMRGNTSSAYISRLLCLAIELHAASSFEEASRRFHESIERAAQGKIDYVLNSYIIQAAQVSGIELIQRARYDLAQPLLEAVLQFPLNRIDPQLVTTHGAQRGLATLCQVQGRYEEARDRYVTLRRHLTKSRHPDAVWMIPTCLVQQGRCENKLGAPDRALKAYQNASQWIRKAGIDLASLAADIDTNIGCLLLDKGEPVRAREHLQAALDWYVENREMDRIPTAKANMARVLAALDEREAAEQLLREAVRQERKTLGVDHPSTMRRLSDLATICAIRGSKEEALVLETESLDARADMLEQQLSTLSESERLLWAAKHRLGLDRVLALSQATGDSETAAYRHVLRWKGLVSRGLFAERELLLRERSPRFITLTNELRDVQSAISNEIFGTAHDVLGPIAPLSLLAKRRDHLNRELAKLVPKSNENLRETLTPKSVRSHLQENQVLVDFLVYRDANDHEILVAFVSGRDVETKRVELGGASELGNLASKFTSWLRSGGYQEQSRSTFRETPLPTAKERAESLHSRLWLPIQQALPADARHLLVCPDGFTASLPFAALPLESKARSTRFLVEDYAISYLQSAADLSSLVGSRKPPNTHHLFLAGDIDYDAAATSAGNNTQDVASTLATKLRPLPSTRAETDRIASLHRAAFDDDTSRVVVRSQQATEERIKNEIPGKRFVHLATHGAFLDGPSRKALLPQGNRPKSFGDRLTRNELKRLLPGLLSFIALTGANRASGGSDDGILTADEVASLDLSTCDLFTLSACQTGRGIEQRGENTLGLRRSLRLAGARASLTALWDVNDQDTADFMISLYSRLWNEKMSTIDALRATQIEWIHAEKRPTWAAFVLDGDWQ